MQQTSFEVGEKATADDAHDVTRECLQTLFERIKHFVLKDFFFGK